MKKLLLLTKTLLVAALLCVGQNAWGDEVVVPTPVYYNDFSFATSGEDGIEIVGNGQFEDDSDERFGRIFHNDPISTKGIRTNFLKLPTNVLQHSASSKEMTIGFWVNVKNAVDYFYCPIFTAYGTDNSTSHEGDAWYPFFYAETRGTLQWNAMGWCDFTDAQNDKKVNTQNTEWLSDKKWHYYSITFTTTTAKVCIDGEILNSWTIADNGLEGLFTQTNLVYVCLGGNQAFGWSDPDPAFGFDDFVVYDKALTDAQITQIISNKLNRSATGTKVGKQDNSTEYVTTTSEKVTLKPGESYHYNFINYNNGTTNHNNWILPVYDTSDARVISVRADNWEDMHHVGETWGSNAGCTSDFNWTNFPGNLNGANVDMTVTFTKDKVFNMSSTINTVDGSIWHYSYTNDYTNSPISLTSNDYVKVALSVSRSWLDITSEGYSKVSGTITPAGWSTFASPYPLDLSGIEGGTAYYASAASAGKVTLSTTTGKVPAGEGIMVKGTPGETFTIPVTADATTAISGNLLKGQTITGNVAASTEGTYHYVFGYSKTDATDYGFYNLASATSVEAGKAYLEITTGSTPARALRISFGDITGVDNVEAATEAKTQEGKFIENGKLVIVKNGVKYNAAGAKLY